MSQTTCPWANLVRESRTKRRWDPTETTVISRKKSATKACTKLNCADPTKRLATADMAESASLLTEWMRSVFPRLFRKCRTEKGGCLQLRPVIRHPKYKTEICKTFHTIGTCPYGKRCRFIHTGEDLVDPSIGSEGMEQQQVCSFLFVLVFFLSLPYVIYRCPTIPNTTRPWSVQLV